VLADAIEASPEAQAAGLEVWVDQRPQGANRLLGHHPERVELRLTPERGPRDQAAQGVQGPVGGGVQHQLKANFLGSLALSARSRSGR
jgi:hypothetical protein